MEASLLGAAVGSYRIVRQIGQGGMGRVYLGEHMTLGKRAAVKVLLPELSTDTDSVTRFFNEARASSRLKHAGFVDVYDFGTLASGEAFIVMEYCDGESLSALVERKGRLDPELALDLARQLANALSVAHDHGIVHRDLKPDNVLIVADSETRHGRRAKILDFGVAKLLELDGKKGLVTRSGIILGTPAYMSPEQCREGRDVDHRSDIYSLGCVIYEMVTGGPPFVGAGAGDIIGAHLFLTPPSLSGIVPAPYDALVERMLAKDADDRVQTMREVATKLPGAPQKLLSAPPQAAFLSSSPTLNDAAGQVIAVAPKTKRSDLRVAIGVALGVAVLGSALVMAFNKPVPYMKPVVAATPMPPAPPTPTPPPRVRVFLTSRPPGAEVYRVKDGVFMGNTPWTTTYNASANEAVFSLRAKGYRSTDVTVKLDRDIEAETILEREDTPPP